jgi:hypothetical protein
MSNQIPSKNSPPSKKLQVTIRMYRPGLGDCFLLRFNKGTTSRYVLIDCGVLQKSIGEKERLKKIVNDILSTTRGHLHVLAVTHEHADHLSGFVFHESIFREKFKIDQVWMPWTENKDDPDVKETFRAYWKIAAQTLDIAIEELKKKGEQYESYQELQDFLTPGAMDVVKDWGKKQLYLAPQSDENGPTTVLPLQGLKDVKVHVLAPPKDLDALKRSDPPKTKNQLDRGATVNQSTAFTTAIFQLGYRTQNARLPEGLTKSDLKELVNLSLPFDSSLGLSMEDASQDPDQLFFQNYYGIDSSPNPDLDWRRIDTDWLGGAGSLALDLDNDINNTSLVLAFELLPSKKILLFAADAQYGNWKSWTGSQTGMDILSRTTFYKVGHHGSHNATQLEGGLLSMNADDLIAMIPVDLEKAKSKHWKMPAAILAQLLHQRTKGRIITNIEEPAGSVPDPNVPPRIPEMPKGNLISDDQWKAFIGAIKSDDSPDHLWIEYTLIA